MIPFGIIDLSLAPTPAVGDSVAEILEEIGLEYAGAPGTTAALAMLNDQVKKGGIMASSYVGGLSGAFIPVSEDQGMIDAVKANALTLEKLEAMTCVCSVGLDMIAIPGDTPATTISGIIADEMAIGMVQSENHSGSSDSGYRKRCWRDGRVWWIIRLCTNHAGKSVFLRELCKPSGTYSGSNPQLQKLTVSIIPTV